MNKLILAALLFVSLSTFSQEPVKSKWRAKTITIDGFPSEWNNPLRLYSTETKLFFDIVNDSNTLFLCFQTDDERTQLKINRAGMKIELLAKGKLKCDAIINFPLTGKKKEQMGDGERSEKQRPDIQSLKHGFILQNVELSAEGFKTENGLILLKDSSAGIKAAINWNDKERMTYELAIPLKELFGNGFSLKELSKALSLVIEVKGFARPEPGSSSSKDDSGGNGLSGGGMGSNTGGMGGGGMGQGGGMGGGMGRGSGMGGGSRQGSYEKSPIFDAAKMKQKFFIALPQ